MTEDSRSHRSEGIAKSTPVSYQTSMQDYRKLIVWQRSRALTHEIYRLTASFPSHERFGLVSQMRRAAISITSNIAEGCGRDSRKELARFMSLASGSAHELESQVYLALDLGLVDEAPTREATAAVAEVKAMLFSYRRTLQGSA
jgi:four helix bundle protein